MNGPSRFCVLNKTGYHVVRLSPIVGLHGRIIAEDVVAEYLRSLRSRVRDLGLQNVVISLVRHTIQVAS
jgi:hypothetical protein